MNKEFNNSYSLSKQDVFNVLVDKFRDEPKIISLAENARAFYMLAQERGIEKTCFPMLGSMGQEVSMGLGVALGLKGRTEKKTIVISGDGSFLANLNLLTTAAMLEPKNLIIFVIDNEVHGITGGQPTATSHIALDHIATDCRFKSKVVATREELLGVCDTLRAEVGPHFVQIKVNRDKPPVRSLQNSPAQLFSQFREYLKSISG